MNKVSLVGRLTRDPEIRYSQGESVMCIASFSVAVNRRFKHQGEQDADFINCKAFGKTGEFVEKYFNKGMKIGLTGRIQTGSYTNREGNKVYTTDVIAEEVEFVESKSQQNNRQQQSNNYEPAYANPPKGFGVGDGFMDVPDGIDEELPFN